MHSFFSFMTPKKSQGGLPPEILENLRFFVDYKQKNRMTIRVDGANEYIVNYTYNDDFISQSTASYQPKIDNEGILFEDNYLFSNDFGYREIWFVVNSLDGSVFNSYDCLFSVNGFTDPFIYADVGATTLGVEYSAGISEVKINNVLTKEFAPLSNFKTVKIKLNSLTTQIYLGILSFLTLRWNGYIKGALFFTNYTTESEGIIIQNYLENYYSL
jgi:hypothetical protein